MARSLVTDNVASHFLVTAEVWVWRIVHALARRLDPVEALSDFVRLVYALHVLSDGSQVIQPNALVPPCEISKGDSTRLDERVTVGFTPPVIAQIVAGIVVKVE